MPVQTFTSLRAAGASGAYFRRTVLVRLAAFLALTLPLLWLTVGAERSQLSAIAREQSNLDVQNLAHAFSEEVNATIGTVDLSLLHLRAEWDGDPRRFQALVEGLNRELHDRVLLQVAVTDARGRLVFSTAGPASGMDVSDREQVRFHLDGHGDELFVSRPVLGRVSGMWEVQFTRPVYGKDGTLRGVIIAAVAPDYFSRFYSNIELGPGASIALVRRDGTVVARTTGAGGNRDMGKVLAGWPYHQDRVFRPGHPASGLFSRVGQLDGVERFYAWRDLRNYPLMVTVGQSVKDANARYARQKGMLTAGAVGVTLLLALLGWAAIAAADNRRRAVDALAAAEARWKLALNASGEGVWDCNFTANSVMLSPRAQAIIGVDSATIAPTLESVRALVHPEDTPRLLLALRDHLGGHAQDFVAEHRVRRPGGDWGWVLARGVVAERAPGGRALRMVGTFADIDARKSEEQQMRYQAHHDVLTGLPNRLLFADRLQQAVRAAHRERTALAVLYFDLDKFKPVNDTYGHAVGDALLAEVAGRVSGSLRVSDTLARVGGDEFVVLLPRCADAAQARKVGENILEQLKREFVAGGQVLHISGSIGYALFPADGHDGEALLRSADLAMYAAKSAGRGCVRGAAEHEQAAA
jgi:diguanylate cyclase (GGDEF)-like protein/PAS domain S-box-containing protein